MIEQEEFNTLFTYHGPDVNKNIKVLKNIIFYTTENFLKRSIVYGTYVVLCVYKQKYDMSGLKMFLSMLYDMIRIFQIILS